jgi:hypothetical protein
MSEDRAWSHETAHPSTENVEAAMKEASQVLKDMIDNRGVMDPHRHQAAIIRLRLVTEALLHERDSVRRAVGIAEGAG